MKIGTHVSIVKRLSSRSVEIETVALPPVLTFQDDITDLVLMMDRATELDPKRVRLLMGVEPSLERRHPKLVTPAALLQDGSILVGYALQACRIFMSDVLDFPGNDCDVLSGGDVLTLLRQV